MFLTLLLTYGSPSPALADDDLECTQVGAITSANIKLYRCEDWEAGKICYLNNFGFLFCLDE